MASLGYHFCPFDYQFTALFITVKPASFLFILFLLFFMLGVGFKINAN